MKLATPLIGSTILIALMLAASALAWGSIGAGLMPVHFGVDGQPNGFMPRMPGVVLMPMIAAVLSASLALAPLIMPANGRIERSWGPYVVVWLGVLALLLVTHLAMLAWAVGLRVDIIRGVVVGVGALIAVIGNLLGKVRYNYMFGIRTPWTLSNERVWDRTHRFAGWAMALGGLLVLIAGLLTPGALEPYLHWAMLTGILVPVLASIIYSALESRRIERLAAS